MTEVRPALSHPASGAHATVPGVRPLTAGEAGHLDRARAHLRASGADLSDTAAVGVLLHSARTRWAATPGTPVPAAMVMALGVGVGDLVVSRVPGARWALRTAGEAPTPAVVSASGDDAALPLADVAGRWRTGCTPQWVAEYVTAASAHLSSGLPDVPSPRSRGTESVTTPSRATYRTPADLPHPPSPAVQDIALGVLDQALEVALAPGGPVTPFAVVDGSPVQGHDPRRFGGDSAQALQAARAWVRTTGATRAAVAWFGRLPGDDADPASVGRRAVLVEASDVGAPSLVVAHRYSAPTSEGTGRSRPARPLGQPLVLGQGAPLL
ncbi:hypothetical protein [uncultured Cellulomonas sp.]|uniref:hypothetical protein n=1 Tax=uncultured Cellulomonas sp. TaxID=189682 RepID=UPI0028EA721B|nr:hypothetical protein [uncultured Cellulomonas sp.]